MKPLPGMYDVQGAAKAAGVSVGALRMWESKHGWPRPMRAPNGYRMYSQAEVELLQRVGKAVKAGAPLAKVIVDGAPVIPGARRREHPALAVMRAVEMPSSVEGGVTRHNIELAVARADLGRLAEVLAESQFLATPERLRAAVAPVIAAMPVLKPGRGLNRLVDLLNSMLGGAGAVARMREMLLKSKEAGHG